MSITKTQWSDLAAAVTTLVAREKDLQLAQTCRNEALATYERLFWFLENAKEAINDA